ncbi:helix-turn-helix transcriptional regulator [Embleya hyalina]|uniref:AraC family transcriptional regulator n=1 Tax=Embleya hyalina TaxID=516124 RepID=A0A401YM77_9ACTN|nr:helix-turn-helix domain-containing protein [Embleya hyalina]GCD95724.1 AraC family transcriptional regulator [Embleya hyalina]
MVQRFALTIPPAVLIVSDTPEHSFDGTRLLPGLDTMIGTVAGRRPEWLRVGPAGRDAVPRERLRASAAGAHALVLLTAVRNNSFSGEIKLALDHLAGGPVRRKPVGLVSVGAARGTHAVDHLRVVLAALDAVVIPSALTVPGPPAAVPRRRAARAEPPPGTLSGFVEELLWFTGRLRADAPNTPAAELPAADPVAEQVDSAVSFIREKFADNELTLGLAARAAHMSKYHFSRTFKKRTGHRFIDFVTELRMELARSLLLESDLPVADICLRVGYRDLSHFQRTFKATYSLSPSVFRSAARAGFTPNDVGAPEPADPAARRPALCAPGEGGRS